MCDLIDLNSPDAKGSLDPTKLASPLIPAPKSVESNGEINSLMITEKRRESDGNNPFDRVLHETVEYATKKDDPFEMMLQRALKSKRKGNIDLRARSVNFADDFTPKSKKRYLKTRNKTLDGSLLENKLDVSNGDNKVEMRKETDSFNMRNIDVCDNNMIIEPLSYKDNDESISMPKQSNKIVVNPESLELSILNQSAMNDTLLETVPKFQKDDNIPFFLEKDTLFKEFILLPNNNLKRSLSQGTGRSPTLSYLNRRSQSVTNDEKKISQNDYNIAPSFLDKGFFESRCNEQSVFSTLSNVSSIAKLNSISSISSSVLSVDTMNHAFLDSNSLKASQEKINTSDNSVEMKSKQYNFSDLAERLEKLKCAMNGTINISNKIDAESDFIKEENKQTTNDKLIDVDVFLPEENTSKERNKSSSSATSLESVFTDTNKANKSIMDEAKLLSKTFEELALRTDSGSSIDDDLISNNTLWMSELLPAFEDDLVVDNLIELPISPEKSSRGIRNSDKEQSLTNIDNVDENSLKEIEPQFTDCVQRTVVTSLLADLRKLIKVENNPQVNKLLDNLENVLDTNCKNNTELLVTCLNLSNEWRSPKKISSDIEKSEVINIDKSEEENEKISFKEEICNVEKLPSDINCKLENTSEATTNSSDNLSLKPSSYENNNDNHLNIKNSPKKVYTNYAEEKDNQSDEKLAIELLMNLGKLLNGQVEDATTMQLLKCIGKALNVASNNYKIENEIQSDSNKMHSIQQITPKKTSEYDRNAHSFIHSTKVEHRRSFDRKSKMARRSISMMRLPKNTQIQKVNPNKSSSEFEDRKKRFSSDSGLIGNLANKKIVVPEACNMEKAEVQCGTKKKEKFIAISDVKNKFKQRTDVVNKRGPMKAVHPVDNMQKKATLIGKQTAPSSQTITPPKSDKTTPCRKIVSSTPNSMDDKYYMAKKSARSQPVASSTPDDQNSKASKAKLMSANKKHNLSCDISPVTPYINTSGSGERKDSPKKPSKLPTPKKCTTPKAEVLVIPKFSTPPKHNFSLNHVNHQRSPQRLNRSLIMDRQRYSPVRQKKSAEKVQQSPLKENRITAKVKPLNLISKLKQHGTGDSIDKENHYA
ncbi:putative uncharacterized protein DDB_G0282133 [Cataglyphis hispanica]|uniref:putative uncharacterized protein DDB_G0282133 n=1 Tax=Cataglyphis hispanica TaxID=1086592 RepID=UPI00217FA6CC|nr:putative uncharacterized protein DDB_G0282133 [Cataglyphis hispanica]XP_050453342.1 putative uncharacterized protein DDB_G0282133 [Cataglyphis hispanica]